MKVSRADTGRKNRKWGFGIFFFSLSLLLSFCFQLSHLLWQCFPLTKRHLGSCQSISPVIQGFWLGKDFIVFVITTLAHLLICELYLYTSKDVFLWFFFFFFSLGWQHLWTWQSWCHVLSLASKERQMLLLLRLLINSNAFCILEQICWLWDQNERGVKVAKSQSRWPGCQDKNTFSFTKYSFILYSPWALRVCTHTFQKKDKL